MNLPQIAPPSSFRGKESSSYISYAPVISDQSPDGHSNKRAGTTMHLKAALTIIATIGFLVFAFLFYIIMAARKNPTAIPWPLASWIHQNPTLSTLLITFIATTLSACSTYLFTFAIRYSVAVFLSRSMTIFMLGLSIQMSNRSLVFYREHPKWTLIGLAYLLATGFLTAGWSALLTPVPILLRTPLAGRDIDLTSPNFNKLFKDFATDPSNFLDLNLDFTGSVDTSGLTAASGFSGVPLLFNFDEKIYNVSTSGTLPAHIGLDDLLFNSTDDTLSSNRTFPQGFNSNFTMIQQGYTADVTCGLHPLDPFTTPPLTTLVETSVILDPESIGSNATTNAKLFYTRWMTMCGSEQLWSDTATTLNNNTLMGLGCLNPANGTNNFTLLVYGNGTYNLIGPVVCNISPRITRVKVDYGSTVQTTVVNPLVSNDPVNAMPIINQIALGIVQRRFLHGQNLNGNDVGDGFATIIANMNATAFQQEPLNQEVLEGYIKGVMEFSATLYRKYAFAIASADSTVRDDVLSATTNITGNYNTETLGYNLRFDASLLILLPVTIVSLATIGLIVLALCVRKRSRYAQDNGNPRSKNTEQIPELDVGDPFHLMAAASAGGLSSAFGGSTQVFLRESKRMRVSLAEGSDRGFVPVHSTQ